MLSIYEIFGNGQNYTFGATNPSKFITKTSSPHDQIWTKLQFWIYNPIQMYPVAAFETYWRNVTKTAEVKVNGHGHQMTKYGQKCSFGAIIIL